MKTLTKILVVGGTGGIGFAFRESLSKYSYLYVHYSGSECLNLASETAIDSFIKEYGYYDIIFDAAGINIPKSFDNLSKWEIQHTLEVNTLGLLSLIQKHIPYWKERKYGRVVAISSLYGFLARKQRLPYTISKHALNGAIKSLALEYAKDNILFNTVSPGFVDTELTHQNNSQQKIDKLIEHIPIGRLCKPEEIAKIAVYLALENDYITGQDIVVDGGYSIGGFEE